MKQKNIFAIAAVKAIVLSNVMNCGVISIFLTWLRISNTKDVIYSTKQKTLIEIPKDPGIHIFPLNGFWIELWKK